MLLLRCFLTNNLVILKLFLNRAIFKVHTNFNNLFAKFMLLVLVAKRNALSIQVIIITYFAFLGCIIKNKWERTLQARLWIEALVLLFINNERWAALSVLNQFQRIVISYHWIFRVPYLNITLNYVKHTNIILLKGSSKTKAAINNTSIIANWMV